jgi:hypothetical protein
MAGRCRPLRAGRLLPLVEGMVRLRRGFSSSPAASQCPCGTPARQEARGQAAIASILFNHLLARMAGGGSARLWAWTRPVGQRRHLLGRCGPGPKGPPACRCSGGSPHSTIQPHPCLLPAPASSASVCSCCGLPCRSVLTLWLPLPRSVRDALVQNRHSSTFPQQSPAGCPARDSVVGC